MIGLFRAFEQSSDQVLLPRFQTPLTKNQLSSQFLNGNGYSVGFVVRAYFLNFLPVIAQFERLVGQGAWKLAQLLASRRSVFTFLLSRVDIPTRVDRTRTELLSHFLQHMMLTVNERKTKFCFKYFFFEIAQPFPFVDACYPPARKWDPLWFINQFIYLHVSFFWYSVSLKNFAQTFGLSTD